MVIKTIITRWAIENEFGHHQISNQIFNFPITKLHDQNVLVTIHGD
jgi:hypothetical protein